MNLLPESLAGCLETVSATVMSAARQWVPELAADEVVLGSRRFRFIRLLGEGGYSFVYLVREVAPEHARELDATEYALKKVQAASQEQLTAARFEIAVMSRLRHPNLLPLLASQIRAASPSTGGGTQYTAYMLFPLYSSGSVADLMERLNKDGRSLPASEVISIFVQVARALQAMHSVRPQPLLHRDVKPHNVLLRTSGHNDGGGRRRSRYQAVLMDFGSVQEGPRQIRSRAEALAMQVSLAHAEAAPDVEGPLQSVIRLCYKEDAERNCTAPYRAPELFDVASECTIDDRVDTWSLGCLLYFMMHGESPFERVLNEAGGRNAVLCCCSLMLAVINGSISWPARETHSEELRALVIFCLNSDPATRPHVEDVIRVAMDCVQHGDSRRLALSAV